MYIYTYMCVCLCGSIFMSRTSILLFCGVVLDLSGAKGNHPQAMSLVWFDVHFLLINLAPC